MSSTSSGGPQWLDLSAAADYLGVHFTTLRRWTDNGVVPCIRTPGGRRRYQLAELTAFLATLQQGEPRTAIMSDGNRDLGALLPPKRLGISTEPWYVRLDETQRSAMRHGGQQLMAVLIQYVTRTNGGEAFLLEGQRLAAAYGEINCQAGLSLIESLRAFMLVRRSISDSLHQAARWQVCPTPTPGVSTGA